MIEIEPDADEAAALRLERGKLGQHADLRIKAVEAFRRRGSPQATAASAGITGRIWFFRPGRRRPIRCPILPA
jgi:hypothetical protein